MHVSYGVQGFYREHGIEPHCHICEHFRDNESGWCDKHKYGVSPKGCCQVFERAVGADDEAREFPG